MEAITLTSTKNNDAVEYMKALIRNGRKIGVFSCEDPYNTPFHRDILNITDYVHLVPKAAGAVVPESVDLGLQAKGINAWGIFGHYGIVHGHEVCAAINALNNGQNSHGPDLSAYIQSLTKNFQYQPKKSLRENIIAWIEIQHKLLLQMIKEKQAILKGAVQGDIIIFGGLLENSSDGKNYQAKILFTNE